jgi:adenine deaminase
MQSLHRRIQVGRGTLEADLVLKNTKTLDVFSGKWLTGDIAIVDGFVAGVGEHYEGKASFDCAGRAVVPGFIDSHVHIESTMMLPSEFSRAVLRRGTTASLWDPHEIANVFGVPGLEWALACAAISPVDLFVMLSSCVPSSIFETAGAKINAQELAKLKNHPRALGLAEVMDFPSVLNGDKEVLAKLMAFTDRPIDGHSPMLRGKDLNGYIAAGIRTCHEICSVEEAQEKLSRGMRVLIREGSVAKNAADLVAVLNDYSGTHCMLCTDDRNPLDIHEEGHLDFLLRIAMEKGKSPEVAYRSASLSPALHYGLKDRGALAPGYLADLVVLEDLRSVKIHRVFKSGKEVDGADWKWPESPKAPRENSIEVKKFSPEAIAVKASGTKARVNAIAVIPNQILTGRAVKELPVKDGVVQSSRETQKMVVFERHKATGNIGIGYVTGFELREGAIASTVAHDAHNIGIVGASDAAILAALEAVTKMGGGIVAVDGAGKILAELPLPVAGLMSREPFEALVPRIQKLRAAVGGLGCPLKEPFLQMSFLALPVIPSLKISDLGLVDVDAQKILPVLADA